MNGQASFKKARDTIKDVLCSQNLAECPYGTGGPSVSALTLAILALTISSPECANCKYPEASIDDQLSFVLYEKEDAPNQLVIG
jgi:hypothetical protein